MKFALVALFLVLAASNAQNPGVGVTVTQRVVDSFKNAFLTLLEEKIESFVIPDFTSNGVEFKNIRITSPGITNNNAVALLKEGYVEFGVENFNMVIQGDAHIHLLFLKFHNGFILTANGNSVSVDIVPTMTDSLHFTAKNAAVQVGNVDLKITGFLGQLDTFLINLFYRSMTSTINQKLSELIRSEMIKSLQDISFATQTQQAVGKNHAESPFAINFTWVDTPSIHTGYMTGGLNGTIYLTNNPHSQIPFTDTTVIPTIDTTSNAGIQLFFSQYVPQTFLYDLQAEGLLALNITQNILPQNSPISMNTNSLNLLFPGLTKKFGSNQPCYMFCYADNSTYPKAVILQSGMGVNLTSLCSLYAQYQSTQQWGLATTFKTTLNLLGGVTLNSTGNRLSFNVSSLSVSGTQIVVNNIGFLSGALLQSELNAVLTGFKTVFNTILSKQSVPLPNLPDAYITDASLTLHNGYIEVVGEPVFKPVSMSGVTNLLQEESWDSDYEIFDA